MADGQGTSITGQELDERRIASLRHIEYMIGALLVLAMIAAISLAKVVVLPIVLGFLFALTLSPLVRLLVRMHLPIGIASVLVITFLGSASAFGLYMMSGPAAMLMDTVPEMQAAAEDKLHMIRDKMEQMEQAEKQVEEMTGNGDGERIVVDDPGLVQSALASVAGLGSTLVVALILAMFLLAAGDMFQHKLVRSFNRFGDKKRAIRISHDIERQISRYLGAITIINAGLGVAVGLALWGLGMPYPYIWGVAAFALNYLPYLGAMIGVAAVSAFSLITYDTTGQMLLPPLVYFTLTSIEGQLITPVLVGRHLSLNAPAVFVAVIFWAWLWGFAGALMAVPFLVVVKVVCDNIPAVEFIGIFLGGEDDRIETD
ncbi:AI-2E family transporter [Pseudooceanicola onchidii]|uniref:AI-2E family transporter n=1 Tax=Pseudooceanicola onchidii TaxID=2562279 RepID=UPI001F0FBA19|nr:AI-2E family transporter [Pseudooceanicola onchidii]